MRKEKSAYNIQTVGHALDILEQFRGTVDELGITELSSQLNLHKNKVYRLLATLEVHDYIEQNKQTSGYRLGMKNLQLGQDFVKQSGLLRHARPALETLSRKSEETSCLAVMKDFKVIYLDAVNSDLPVRVGARVGKIFPLHCTAAGKVLAAGVDEEKLLEYFKNTKPKRYTANTICDPDELRRHLNLVSERGYAVEDEELDPGVICLGAPVRDHTRSVVGAISVSVPLMRFIPQRIDELILPLVKETAETLSAKLGYKVI